MGKKSDSRIIILSIHPEYASAILNGEKTVEFRRNGVPEEIDIILLYATSPIQAVVGYCAISDCVVARPSQLWKMYGSSGKISRKAFDDYYEQYRLGKCYIIQNAFKFVHSISLFDAVNLKKPPQSFAYVDSEVFTELEKLSTMRECDNCGCKKFIQ